VAAPRGCVCNKHILGLILDDFLPLGADDDLDGIVVGLGDGRGLVMGGESSVLKVSDELGDETCIESLEVTFELVFLEGCTELDNAECRHVFLGDADELCELFLDTFGHSCGREVEHSLVIAGNLLEHLVVVGISIFREEEDGIFSFLEDEIDIVTTKLKDSGHLEGLGPGLDLLVLEFASEEDLGLIKAANDKDARGLGVEFFSTLLRSVQEGELLEFGALSSGHEFIESSTFVLSEVDNILLSRGCLVSEGCALDGLRWVLGLLSDPLDDILGDTSTVVLGEIAISEPFESRVT